MKSEIYKIAAPNKALIFIGSVDMARISAFGSALCKIGAVETGPQMFAISVENNLAELVRDAVGELIEGESIYVLCPNDDSVSQQVIVRPRTDGGVFVR